jgi:hypothetical protein
MAVLSQPAYADTLQVSDKRNALHDAIS